MYICDCGKTHELTQEQYDFISEGLQVNLKCNDCRFNIMVGAEYNGEGYDIYSWDVK